MPTLELVLPALHPGQRTVKQAEARFGTLACGRRWGKTLYGVDYLASPALESWPVAWFAPTYKLLLEVWRDFERLLRPVIKRSNATDRRIELVTGGVIEFWTMEDGDAGRSRKYKRVFIDEAGMVPRLLALWHEAIMPTLADLRGGARIAGTPKGRNGFWKLFQHGADPLQAAWSSWQRPTHDNPHIPPDEIELLRETMSERAYRQEILAEFLEDGGGVFRRVQEAATLAPLPHAEEGAEYVGGIDWGRSNDYTVLSVIDITNRKQVALDRFSQTEYELQRARFAAMHERFKVRTWVAETNSMGGPMVERLQRDGFPVQGFTTSNATKAHAIDALALAFERGELTILADEVQTAELLAYEASRLPSGATRYAAPEGMHDDTVMSLALAWFAADRPHAASLVDFA